jgi:NRPS condensation-like uncharacterized protein
MKSNQFPASAQDQMNHITRANADQQLHVVVYFEGHLDQERMDRAIRIAMHREPVLGCRFVEQPRRSLWVRREDLDTLPVVQGVETQDEKKDLMAFVTTPADPASDPLVQALILRRGDGDVLCIKVNHVVADGAGTKAVAYLIADTYSRLAAEPTFYPHVGRFTPRSQMAIFKQVGLKNMIKYRPRQLSLPKPQFALPFKHQDTSGRQFVIRQIGPAAFKALKDDSKKHQATINDLILTAYYRALGKMGNPPADMPLPIQVSIDLRHFLPKERPQDICNLSGALFPAIYYQAGEDFEQTLLRVQEKMIWWKSRLPGLTGPMLIELVMVQGYQKAKEMLAKMTSGMSQKANPVLLSNFGILEQDRLVFGGLKIREAYELGPVMFGHGLMLTASTYQGQLTLAMGFCEGLIPRENMENMVQMVADELLNRVAWTVPAESLALQPMLA